MTLYFQEQFLKLKCTENAKSPIKKCIEKWEKEKIIITKKKYHQRQKKKKKENATS